MVQSLQLGGTPSQDEQQGDIRRLNRLPIIIVIVLAVLFFAVIIYGLSSRGLYFQSDTGVDAASNNPASTYADQLKRGVTDGIIGEPAQTQVFQPTPAIQDPVDRSEERPTINPSEHEETETRLEPEKEWLARLEREQRDQYLREQQRQRMAKLQARSAALDSPLTVDVRNANANDAAGDAPLNIPGQEASPRSASDLYSAALRSGLGGQNIDPNGQMKKADFFNQDIKDLGYLPNSVVPQLSPYELKRGSVVPATLITGINSDLPGRITAQVSQHVFDSATGHRLLIPQGAKLFGRYDSDVSFGQSRVLVVWTDIIFPNGSTLQIGGMAGTDAQGYGGFKDKVDRHYLRTFGSAALLAIIGTGIDMAVPESSTLATQDTASDAARRNFAETFGRVVERTINKNLDVQPTLEIRPGYKFNVLVDHDIIFPPYKAG
ncbi:IncP-type conjugal transfer protein TrbI [Rhizobium sp. PL01]|uniref:IncP-type conjugal transfer protein TrbI n=1 Tax=Rhizobium sp. PL01 TaxID=3085631 RepID=UPI00298292EB|nr:IncP-type conjugal transfer protein TrbI [Rhizobium sp. PL01]MDW5318329.1 IncP-type conjugal transfer protein TrbI [Rhizobium sp. PL01]